MSDSSLCATTFEVTSTFRRDFNGVAIFNGLFRSLSCRMRGFSGVFRTTFFDGLVLFLSKTLRKVVGRFAWKEVCVESLETLGVKRL